MQLGPFTIARTKTLGQMAGLRPFSPGSNGWWPIIRESFTGAWQQGVEIRAADVLTYSVVYACVSLIAGDIAKLCLRLVEQDQHGVWTAVEVPAFSPVLRKPNRYQTIIKFVEAWVVSKLTRGNTYVLKQRDRRGVVTALYVLDPSRVIPLVTHSGDVYYQIRRDDLSEVAEEMITVPASEIIHDVMCALWHPLIGVSPIYACGLAALQGLSIQKNSNKFFANGSQPGGVLTAPGAISDETAARLKLYWDTNYTGDNVGKVAVLGDGLNYQGMSVNAVDAQLIQQLDWTGHTVCTCFHVPPYMVGVGPPPPYANIEPLLQQYYSQCIQSLVTALETCLDDGLALPGGYGVEFDIDDLLWMDTATKTKAAVDSIHSGGMTPNEARAKYYGLGPITGGDTAYMQVQNYSLAALAKRDAGDPFAVTAPERITGPAPVPVDTAPGDAPRPAASAAKFAMAMRVKSTEHGLYAV